jgi:maleylpyruvate isomerase
VLDRGRYAAFEAPEADVGLFPGGINGRGTIDQITAATECLLAAVTGLGDEDMRAPSLLPGWTRGHVLTHVARNAEGGTRLLTWARTGVPAAEYRSLAARAADIEAGAGRSAAELIDDVRAGARGFAAEYAMMPDAAWRHVVQWTAGQRHPAARIADARLCEVLVHHVDLRAGRTPDDWPADFVTHELNGVTAAFRAREDPFAVRIHATDTDRWYEVSSGADGTIVRGRQASLLAWLMGRSAGADLATDTGGRPPAPTFLY